MEKDPAKDPFMDNVIRLACMVCLALMIYHSVVGVIARWT
jgi:hypothetical protein